MRILNNGSDMELTCKIVDSELTKSLNLMNNRRSVPFHGYFRYHLPSPTGIELTCLTSGFLKAVMIEEPERRNVNGKD